MRRKNMDAVLTILIPLSSRRLIEDLADEQNKSLAEVAREFMADGMRARGLMD